MADRRLLWRMAHGGLLGWLAMRLLRWFAIDVVVFAAIRHLQFPAWQNQIRIAFERWMILPIQFDDFVDLVFDRARIMFFAVLF